MRKYLVMLLTAVFVAAAAMLTGCSQGADENKDAPPPPMPKAPPAMPKAAPAPGEPKKDDKGMPGEPKKDDKGAPGDAKKDDKGAPADAKKDDKGAPADAKKDEPKGTKAP